MTILVYRINSYVSRSLRSAVLVAEVDVDELPENLSRFAKRYGGDFAEVQFTSPILEELLTA